MRIVSGTMRGTKLFTLDGLNTRPTLDRVKESLFNILQYEIQDAIILDLFAGSGALSLEALSRGAKRAILCDSSFEAINIIKKNIQKTKTEEKITILHMHYEKALEKLKTEKEKVKIVFLDPPYDSNFAQVAAKKIIEFDLLEEDGVIIIETDQKDKVIKDTDDQLFEIYDIRKYGRVDLLFLKRKG